MEIIIKEMSQGIQVTINVIISAKEECESSFHKAMDVDVAERALEAVMDCVAKNKNKFSIVEPDNVIMPSSVEIWGSIDRLSGVIKINKSVLCEFLDKNGFDYTAVSKKWAERKQIRKNSQGKYAHNTKVNGTKANYIFFKNNERTDK